MRIIAELDPWTLEERLCRHVEQLHRKHRPRPIFVLVPNTGAVKHVERRLLERRGAWIGLRVVHPRALAFEIVARKAETPRMLRPRVREALLARILRAHPANPCARWIERRPGAARGLTRAVDELRESGTSATAARRAAATELERGAAEIFARYEAALAEIRRDGHADEAGLVGLACELAGEAFPDLGGVVAHGAYEWTGVNVSLLRALGRRAEPTVFLPGSEGRVGRYGARTAAKLGDAEATFAARPGSPERIDLASLYEEASRPASSRSPRISFRHAQGAAAEVRLAVRGALAAIGEGCPPEKVTIAARSLEPYAAALEEVLLEEGLPARLPAAPLRRSPLVRDFLSWLEVVDEDFPLRPTIRLLRAEHAGIERAARDARIFGGLEEWTELLPPELANAADELRAWAAAPPSSPARFDEHASALTEILRRRFPAGDERDALEELLADMAAVCEIAGDRRSVPLREARAWLERACLETLAPCPDPGGIRVCDVMQLRGTTCRYLHLLGMNAGSFPRSEREDPFLGDSLRRALGLPLSVERADEERLLLALTLGAATERLVVSWQRADESGRARSGSLALREVSRVAYGRPDLERLRADPSHHFPSHPQHAIEHLARDPGLLSPGDARLLATLSGRYAVLPAGLEGRFPELSSGLTMLRSTQSFRPVETAWDGVVGPGPTPEAFSVSSLERLGRCPLQYFFRHVLRIHEPVAPRSRFAVELPELGRGVHEVLEATVEHLRDGGYFARPLPERIAAARSFVHEHRARVAGPAAERLLRRLPVLWERFTDDWSERIARFLAEDLTFLDRLGVTEIALEDDGDGSIDFGRGFERALTARFDRRVETAEGRRIGDYKVSRRIAERTSVAAMLRGRELQAPLYHLLAGEAAVELLGLHPSDDARDSFRRATFTGFRAADRASFRETMRTLFERIDRGEFPLEPSASCRFCAYAGACRRRHPPTLERRRLTEGGAAMAALREKVRAS